MAEPFMAEIRIVGFDFAPRGWAFCNGQFLPINQNQSLFSLLGTAYGGDGRTTFALPNLQSRTPMHRSTNQPLGSAGGEENHTLSAGEMPPHIHQFRASSDTANQPVVPDSLLARTSAADIYRTTASNMAALASSTIANAGGGQAHQNMQPYVVLNFCIALTGIIPT